MDILWICGSSLLAIVSIYFFLDIFFPSQKKKKLPPSPPALPICGHLHLLKLPIHRTFQQLSAKYGPIFYLRLGNRPAIVVSSPLIAEQCFTKNDIIFGDRPQCIISDHSNFDHAEVTFLAYGDQWRNIRRIMTINIFSSTALKHYSSIREEEIRFLVRKLLPADCNGGDPRRVNLKCLFSDLILNMIMKATTGRRWSDSEPFNKDVLGSDISLHLCDFVPFLRRIGFQGFENQVNYFSEELKKYLKYLIDEGRKSEADTDNNSSSDNKNKTIIQSLLSLQKAEPDYYTDNLIMGILTVRHIYHHV